MQSKVSDFFSELYEPLELVCLHTLCDLGFLEELLKLLTPETFSCLKSSAELKREAGTQINSKVESLSCMNFFNSENDTGSVFPAIRISQSLLDALSSRFAVRGTKIQFQCSIGPHNSCNGQQHLLWHLATSLIPQLLISWI